MEQYLTLDIPYIRLGFFAELTEDTQLPPAKTAALRGGMGEMLLTQNCVSDRKCEFKELCAKYGMVPGDFEVTEFRDQNADLTKSAL